MKLETKQWLINFKSLFNKVTDWSKKDKEEKIEYSTINSSLTSSYTNGYTRGFADFLPNRTHEWFVSNCK